MPALPEQPPGLAPMSVLLSPTAIRALLLAAVLAGVAALMAPAARGAPPPAGPAVAAPAPAAGAVLADDFSWSEFVKYWANKAGSLQGVVGTVVLVAATAVLIILSKGRWG
jgi:hypothetical protein